MPHDKSNTTPPMDEMPVVKPVIAQTNVSEPARPLPQAPMQAVPDLSKAATNTEPLAPPPMPITPELKAALFGFIPPNDVSCASDTAANCAAPNKSGPRAR